MVTNTMTTVMTRMAMRKRGFEQNNGKYSVVGEDGSLLLAKFLRCVCVSVCVCVCACHPTLKSIQTQINDRNITLDRIALQCMVQTNHGSGCTAHSFVRSLTRSLTPELMGK